VPGVRRDRESGSRLVIDWYAEDTNVSLLRERTKFVGYVNAKDAKSAIVMTIRL
jgi:hypothetical protein